MAIIPVVGCIVLSPVLLLIIIAFALLSKHIFANVIYYIVFSVFVRQQISLDNHHQTLTKYFYGIIALNTIFTLIRIGLLCIYRRTRTFHRLSLSFMINSIQISLLYTLKTYNNQFENNNTLITIINYNYAIIAILLFSEFWIRSGPNKLIAIENEILKLIIYENKHENQQLDKYKHIDSTLKVERKYCGDISYLHCYTNSSKHKLVIIHGYVVGKCVFAIAIRWLARYFDVYIIDCPGNGLSKPVFLPWLLPNWFPNPEKYDKWTADQIEKWRLCVFDKDEKIFLMGHSTGSYMCSVYTIHYPNKVNYLILCSPICLLAEKEYLSCSGLLQINQSEYGLPTTMLSKYFWSWWTFNDIVRGLGIFGPFIFIKFMKQTHKHHTHFGDVDEILWNKMSNLWFEYTYHLYAQPKSYEDLLYAYMKPWCWPRNPLLNRLKDKLNCNLLLIYADEESSMSDKFGGMELLKQLKELKDWKYKVNLEVINNSSHQLFLNQPVECVKAILRHTHNYK
eukprot:350499_1